MVYAMAMVWALLAVGAAVLVMLVHAVLETWKDRDYLFLGVFAVLAIALAVVLAAAPVFH